VVLALVLLYVDKKYDPGSNSSIAWAYSGGPQGARSLLTTIAGSMITAASVTFSLASVALSIASQQYGSRVLRNFMRDRITQVLLGTFTSTFIYSVLVVRGIRGTSTGSGFVPAISTTAAIALSLVSLILLIVFVHHISASIKASHIVEVIREDLEAAIPNLYPSSSGQPYKQEVNRDDLERCESVGVACEWSGYLQSIDIDTLLKAAERKNVVIETKVRPGDHLIAKCNVAQVRGAASLPQEDLKSIAGAFIVGEERTPAQDIRYQFQQLTQVVVRSLSPAINDPFTAMTGIDQIATSIARFARQGPVMTARADQDGELRVIAVAPQLDELLEHTVGHIAVYGAKDRFVMAGLRRALEMAEPHIERQMDRKCLTALRQKIDRLEQVSKESLEGL
jgi:uncharacterized membrane protein